MGIGISSKREKNSFKNLNHSNSGREAAIIGALIEGEGSLKTLPPNLSRLVENAPESFDDQRHGQIVVAIRDLRRDGKPIHSLAISEKVSFLGASILISQLQIAALPLDLAELEAESIWKAFRVRQVKMFLGEASSALESNPGQAADIADRVIRELSSLNSEAKSGGLPQIDNADALLANGEELPPEIIESVLHLGLKAVIGSGSKARKTWILLDVAISVATGTPFWKWRTRKGRVLYINFEIPAAFIGSRIKSICKRKGISSVSNLNVWTLRGHSAAFGKLLPSLLNQIRKEKYALIIIDPIYKGLGGRDENSAGDIGELCNELEKLAVATGAAVFYAAHFSKGNQARKDAIDRIGGSGVWTRDADCIITLTKHEEDGAFTVDLILRNLPEQPSFAVRWNYPLMEVAADLDPGELEKKGGRKSEHTPEDIFRLLLDAPLTSKEWQERAERELGVSRRTFYTLKKKLETKKQIFKKMPSGDWYALKIDEVQEVQ